MRTWIDVAVLVKTKTLNGRFVARAATGLPFLLDEGIEVRFVPPQLDCPRQSWVTDVQNYDGTNAVVAFSGVEDAATARALVGCHCLVRRADVEEELLEQPSVYWEGWNVVDRKLGEIGEILGIVENPAQSLLEVSRKQEAGSTVLIPVVEEFILGVDADAQVVEVDIPEGLLDL